MKLYGIDEPDIEAVVILASKVYPEARVFQEYRIAKVVSLKQILQNRKKALEIFKDAHLEETEESATTYALSLLKDTEKDKVAIIPLLECTFDEFVTNRRFRKR